MSSRHGAPGSWLPRLIAYAAIIFAPTESFGRIEVLAEEGQQFGAGGSPMQLPWQPS